MMVQASAPKGADGAVAHTEKLRCERPPRVAFGSASPPL